jgi:hypothetical protein
MRQYLIAFLSVYSVILSAQGKTAENKDEPSKVTDSKVAAKSATPASSGKSLRFMVIGDWGFTNQTRQSDPQLQVAQAMQEAAKKAPVDVSTTLLFWVFRN